LFWALTKLEQMFVFT